MPFFKRNNGYPVDSYMTLVEGNTLKLKLEGRPINGARVAHYGLRTDVANMLTITQKADERQREQIITLQAKRSWDNVALRAYHPNGGDPAACPSAHCVPPVYIKIVPQLRLPDINTDAGALARLLLAESLSPRYEAYGNGEDAIRAMSWMRMVVENRLNPKYHSHFGSPSSKTFIGVIKAAGQFEGFQNYPSIGFDQAQVVNDALKAANDGTISKFAKYRRHVEQAIQIATGPSNNHADPCDSGLYGWKTLGSSHPGSNFTEYMQLGGQQFYTMTPGFLLNPNNPGHR